MDTLEELFRSIEGVCPECGCTLLMERTFYKECYYCGKAIWKNFIKEENDS